MLVFQRAHGREPGNQRATLIRRGVESSDLLLRYLMARAENSGFAISSVQDAAEATKISTMVLRCRAVAHHFRRHSLGFIKQSTSSHARLNVPTLVQAAAMAIILIRGLDVLMIGEYPRHTRDGRVYSSQRRRGA